MKLLIGLGNIGQQYERTRHNAGFMVLDEIAATFQFHPWKSEKKFFGKIARGQVGHEKVILLKPETYMNLSGKAIRALMNFYKITPEDVTVFFDDVDLDFGVIRFRAKGGSGGHNGVKSVITALGSQDFHRIKIGVSNELKSKMPTDKFVLSTFNTDEEKQLPSILKKAIETFLTKGAQ